MVSACTTPTAELRLVGDANGDDPATFSWCMGPGDPNDPVLAPLEVTNVGDGQARITGVSALYGVNTAVDEFGVVSADAFAGEPVAGARSSWDDRLTAAWETREPVEGATVDPGETVVVLALVRTLANPDLTAGARGFRVEYDGGGPSVTDNDHAVLFHPIDVTCDVSQIVGIEGD